MPLLKTKIVLCVDDDSEDREMIADVINNTDPKIKIIEAENGLEAYNFLLHAKGNNDLPCLVILDINMPVMDGKKVLTKIKSNVALRDIPVVIFTTSSNAADHDYFSRFNVKMVSKSTDYSIIRSEIKKMMSYCE